MPFCELIDYFIIYSHLNCFKFIIILYATFQPGLWEAVEKDDLLSVRKLINLWCRVNICKVSEIQFSCTQQSK